MISNHPGLYISLLEGVCPVIYVSKDITHTHAILQQFTTLDGFPLYPLWCYHTTDLVLDELCFNTVGQNSYWKQGLGIYEFIKMKWKTGLRDVVCNNFSFLLKVMSCRYIYFTVPEDSSWNWKLSEYSQIYRNVGNFSLPPFIKKYLSGTILRKWLVHLQQSLSIRHGTPYSCLHVHMNPKANLKNVDSITGLLCPKVFAMARRDRQRRPPKPLARYFWQLQYSPSTL